jgi:predicted O-methyltransferase YrrM
LLTDHQYKIAQDILQFASERTEEYWCISRDTGAFIYELIIDNHLQYGVECGSGIGYSSIWIASALKKNSGRFIGFEFFEPKCTRANTALKQARFGDMAEIIQTEATKGIAHLKSGIDFVFLDARKCDYLAQLKCLEPKLKKGAIIVADNTLSHATELEEYLNHVRKKYSSTAYAMGTGIEVSIFDN